MCKIKLCLQQYQGLKNLSQHAKNPKAADPLGVPCSYNCESVLTDKCPTCLQRIQKPFYL